jgi:hypothetical protein
MQPRFFSALLLSLALSGAGCSDDLEPDDHGGDGDADGDADVTGLVETTDDGTGIFTTIVDASSEAADAFVHFSFATADETAAGEAWDLRLRRYAIETNGGVTGDGGVRGAILPGADFEALERAPADGWVEDEVDGDDEDTDPDSVFLRPEAWYVYDFTDHTLTARDQVYVLETATGIYVKVQLLGYYDAAGSPGHIALRWGVVDSPNVVPAGAIGFDTTAGRVHLKVGEGVVAIADPAASADWDLFFDGMLIGTNSGTSGAGFGGGRETELAWDDVTDATTTGFASDTTVPGAGPPGTPEDPGNVVLSAWWDYDISNHTVSPRAVVFLVRTAGGDYAKLELLEADGTSYVVRLEPIARRVAVETTSVSAADPEAWTYLDFRQGALVVPADPSGTADWDLGLNRVNVRTNSGTSGPGTGGALEAEGADLTSITEAPAEGYEVDTLVPLPGPPGSGEISSSAVLGGWYDYNPETHAVSPRAAAFVLRTADGGFVKLRVTGWDDGDYTIEWAYAGAGRRDF